MKKLILVFMCLLIGLALYASGNNEVAAELDDINIQPLVDDGTGAIMPLEGIGPNGEEPVGVEAVLGLMSSEDKEMIRKAGYTATVSLHTTNADWSLLQIAGIKAVLKEFNIELLAVTDAEMSVEKSISDYESCIALDPDLMIVFVLDADASAPVLRKAVDKGIKLSFIDAIPTGFKHPEDYAGMGTADNYANGKASAEVLAEYMGGTGEVAVLEYISSLFHTDQRTQAAVDVFNSYPGITIVATQGVSGAESAATATESLLISHPEIDGIWTVWDVPGMAAVGVIENLNKDIKVVSVDLSEDTAYSIASGGAMLATGAQHPYDQGVAEALIGVASLAGKETPPYVLVPGEKVTRESMAASWKRVFKTDLPADIAEALNN